MLTDRQRAILGAVVTRHVRDGTPVGSKLISDAGLEWSPSTIRAELASLEPRPSRR
jgi:heat-inducible transcriptional repressor